MKHKDHNERRRMGERQRVIAAFIGLALALFPFASRAQSRTPLELLQQSRSMSGGLRGVSAVRLDLQVHTLDDHTPKAYSVFHISRDVGEIVIARLTKLGLKVVDHGSPNNAMLVVRVDWLGTILQEGPQEPTYRVQLVVERKLETVEGPVQALVYEGPVFMVKTTAEEWMRFANRAQVQQEPGDMFLFALDQALERFAGEWEGWNKPAPGKPSGKTGAPSKAPKRD